MRKSVYKKMDSLCYYIIKCHIFLTDKGMHSVLSLAIFLDSGLKGPEDL